MDCVGQTSLALVSVLVDVADPLDWHSPKATENRRKAIELLGDRYFFSKDRQDKETVAPDWPEPN